MNPVERVVRRVDAFQQRHRVTGFAFGVVKKFGDDRAGSLAALIAYYTFLALFPLLLLLVTILGFVAQNNADFQRRLVDSALSEFPIIGTQIARNVKSLRASGLRSEEHTSELQSRRDLVCRLLLEKKKEKDKKKLNFIEAKVS